MEGVKKEEGERFGPKSLGKKLMVEQSWRGGVH